MLAPAVRRLLINRNYALFMAGSFVSALGSWFQGVALGWLVLELSDSPFVLGLANFALMAPLFFLGLIGGVLADRIDRRLLLLVGMSLGTLVTIVLALLALSGRATVPAILVASLLLGLTNAVVWPAWQPFIKDLVPKERLREAISFNAARFNLTRVLGPALAGVLIARAGAPACLAIAAVSSAGVLVATWMIRPPKGVRSRVAPWLSALAEGAGYLRGDPFTLRLLLVTGGFGLLVLPYQAFLPAFARDVLGLGAEGLGLLLTAAGGGAVFGALLTGTPLVARQPGPAMAVFALTSGGGLVAAAILTPANGFPSWIAIPALVVVGLGSIGYLTTANLVVQLRVPDALMGRVMGLWVVLNAGTMPLGSLALGGAAEQYGLPPILLACGVVGVGIGLFLLWHAMCLLEKVSAQPARGSGGY
ncbi:MAG: MFS transporter [Chloroflexota bacterium]|nr:MFS transporter [Chloroflexota bacterium]